MNLSNKNEPSEMGVIPTLFWLVVGIFVVLPAIMSMAALDWCWEKMAGK